MTQEELKQVNTERLALWQTRLDQGHATPQILLGFGQDHNCGQWVICLPEDGLTDEQLIVVLRTIADMLDVNRKRSQSIN